LRCRAALLIGVDIGSADRAAQLDERRLRVLEAQIAALASQVQTVERARPAEESALARRARSDAAAAQGPRLARVLERIGAAPREVRLRRFAVTASGGGWTAAMSGTAIAGILRAQAVVAGLLKDVASLSGVSSRRTVGHAALSAAHRRFADGRARARGVDGDSPMTSSARRWRIGRRPSVMRRRHSSCWLRISVDSSPIGAGSVARPRGYR
jgi:hypothetical protein